MDRASYMRYWHDDTVNIFRVYLQPGAVRPEVQQPHPGGVRRPAAAVRADRIAKCANYIMQVTDQWFGMTYVQMAVAVLVAMLGIVNTLTVSITDRRRELGVLQAVGGLRNRSADHLDGGARHRRHRAGAGPGVGRGEPVL